MQLKLSRKIYTTIDLDRLGTNKLVLHFHHRRNHSIQLYCVDDALLKRVVVIEMKFNNFAASFLLRNQSVCMAG